jgi:hypothetical protein
MLLDLRDVQASVERHLIEGEPRPKLVLVLSDGHSQVELTGGIPGHSDDAVAGAQRVAEAALRYAAGGSRHHADKPPTPSPQQ